MNEEARFQKARKMSVILVWFLPIGIALAIITIMGIGGALPEAQQPAGGVDQGNMYQSFAMYFCCIGAVWSGVFRTFSMVRREH